MYSKIFLNSIFIIISVIFQLSFISGLPLWFNKLNFILVILIFILMFSSIKMALWWAIGIGFLLDIYSFLPFGIYLICLFFTILVANFLLANFFTNRSLYSFLALTSLATLFYNLLFVLIIYFIEFFGEKIIIFSKEFWVDLSIQLIMNLLLVFFLFYVISFVSKKLKPVFLEKT